MAPRKLNKKSNISIDQVMQDNYSITLSPTCSSVSTNSDAKPARGRPPCKKPPPSLENFFAKPKGKKSPAKKTPAKKTPTKRKSPARSPVRRKSPVRKTPAKRKSPARSPVRRKSPVRKTPAKRKSPARKTPVKRKSPARSPVRRRTPVKEKSTKRTFPPLEHFFMKPKKKSPVKSPVRRRTPAKPKSPVRRRTPAKPKTTKRTFPPLEQFVLKKCPTKRKTPAKAPARKSPVPGPSRVRSPSSYGSSRGMSPVPGPSRVRSPSLREASLSPALSSSLGSFGARPPSFRDMSPMGSMLSPGTRRAPSPASASSRPSRAAAQSYERLISPQRTPDVPADISEWVRFPSPDVGSELIDLDDDPREEKNLINFDVPAAKTETKTYPEKFPPVQLDEWLNDNTSMGSFVDGFDYESVPGEGTKRFYADGVKRPPVFGRPVWNL